MIAWKDVVIHALEQLNGHAYLSEIYEKVCELNERTLTQTYKATIRATLERFPEDSTIYNGTENYFYAVDGLGKGHWGLLGFTPNANTIEFTTDDTAFYEGRKKLRKHIVRERDYRVILLAKKLFKTHHNGQLYCEICGFSFRDKYGALGENFIEGHHVKPISSLLENEKTKIEDIMMVCSNCHSMIHRLKTTLNKDELKSIVSNNLT